MAFSVLLPTVFLLSLCMIVSTDPVETIYYSQRVDHFTYGTHLSQKTFTQRLYVDRTFWSGPGGPIFVFIGGEAPLEVGIIGQVGLITESAPHMGALAIYIEHRFYGQSVPYGSIDLAMADSDVRGCLTTSQALADFHHIISGVTKNLSAVNSPVIVMGGSYAGILAALFRLRYPNTAIGALASSAPMYLDFDHSQKFYSVVSEDFQDINQDCYEKIRQSWKVIDDTANQPSGLDYLSQTFNSCFPLVTVEGLKRFLVIQYTYVAQYNGRFNNGINLVCNSVVDPSNINVIEGIARAITAAFSGSRSECLDISSWAAPFVGLDSNSIKAWNWQLCTELTLTFHSEHETMLPPQPFSLSNYTTDCVRTFGTAVRPWVANDELHDITTSLQEFGSNIIFSNGLRDPYSSVGVLEDMSKTIVAIKTKQGSHCLDLVQASPDDPKWLVHQRQKEMRIFMEWIDKAHHPHSSSRLWKPHLWIIQLVLLWFL